MHQVNHPLSPGGAPPHTISGVMMKHGVEVPLRFKVEVWVFGR